MQYNAMQYNTTQYNTIQYNTMQCNTVQYNTIECNTVQWEAPASASPMVKPARGSYTAPTNSKAVSLAEAAPN